MNQKCLFVTIFLLILAIGGGIYVVSTNKPQPLVPSTNTMPTFTTGQTSTPSATVILETSLVATESAKIITMENGLKIEDEVVGTGAEAVIGKKVTVNYLGTLTDGTIFDSSLNPGRTPFEFTLGAGEVIQGWDKGFTGMKVGGKRKLTVPASLGYGSVDYGPIPANSTLIFEVELLKVE